MKKMLMILWLSMLIASNVIATEAQNDVFEQAMEQAKKLKNESNGIPKIPEFKNKDVSVDPELIMRQYKSIKNQDGKTEDLLIFVSSSIPMNALVKLGTQAKKAGAIIVLRGLIGDLNKQGWGETMKFMEPLAKTGASIQIHPELFKQYDVKVVPTFVFASNGIGTACNDDMCNANSIKAEGDVSLDFVLEYWLSKYGQDSNLNKILDAKLEKISVRRH